MIKEFNNLFLRQSSHMPQMDHIGPPPSGGPNNADTAQLGSPYQGDVYETLQLIQSSRKCNHERSKGIWHRGHPKVIRVGHAQVVSRLPLLHLTQNVT
jgi:hypothetical protein